MRSVSSNGEGGGGGQSMSTACSFGAMRPAGNREMIMRIPSRLAGLLCISGPGLPIAKRSDLNEIGVQGAARSGCAILTEAARSVGWLEIGPE